MFQSSQNAAPVDPDVSEEQIKGNGYMYFERVEKTLIYLSRFVLSALILL